MRTVISTALVGLILGEILALAQSYSPSLLPWIIGFMIACLAANIRTLMHS
jgi:hypothetical protein